MADPSATTVIVPAFNEVAVVGDVVSALRAAAPWHEILVVDDGSSDDTVGAATRARRARTPSLQQGDGASVKTGIRHATGEWILIIDGDGQHKPEDAIRLVLAAGRLRPGRRRTFRGHASQHWTPARQRAAERAGQRHLADRRIPDLRRAFGRRGASTRWSSSTCCPTGSLPPPRQRSPSSRLAIMSRSSPSRLACASANRRSGSPGTGRSSSSSC